MSSKLPDWLMELCRAIGSLGGKGFLVGGCVRDRLLGYTIKDYDIEVYALPSHSLRLLLEQFGSVNTVGEQFAVYKLRPTADPAVEVDVSLPRRESKQGKGHRGFLIEGDPWMTFEEATRRRDFTINAILQDPLTESIIDPLNGLRDLRNRKLRIANPSAFAEDSLRVLRAAQLASRYNLQITKETKKLCREINLEDIPKERIYKEFEKILLLSPKPSVGLDCLLKLCVVHRLFPSLMELQSSLVVWNPFSQRKEETIWDYIASALDRSRLFIGNLSDPQKLSVLLSIIGSGLSLPNLTNFLDKLGIRSCQKYPVRDQVIALKRTYLTPYKVFYQGVKHSVTLACFKRLARIVDLQLLGCLTKALYLDAPDEFLEWLDETIQACLTSRNEQRPFITGRDILNMGVKPGPKVGSILRRIQEFQLEGKICTSAEAWSALEKIVKKNSQGNGLRTALT